jgi:hypothetical protein
MEIQLPFQDIRKLTMKTPKLSSGVKFAIKCFPLNIEGEYTWKVFMRAFATDAPTAQPR